LWLNGSSPAISLISPCGAIISPLISAVAEIPLNSNMLY
jgi:hypothetical protein